MGFWGMSDAGKDAQGKLGEIPRWNWDQAKNQWGNAADWSNQGKDTIDWSKNYWKAKAGGNFATPDQIKASGEAMMPGVQEAIAKRQQGLDAMQQQWDGFGQKAVTVNDAINTNLDQQGGMVGQQWDTQQGAIAQGTNNLNALADTAQADIVNSIKDSYGSAGAHMNAQYDELGNRVATNYGGLLKDSADAYAKMGGNVEDWGKQMEMLKPGGEFATARTARAFAPAMASAAGRLRRGGVDPNGLQAAGILGGVEANRARAMDDSMAQGTETYVNAQGQLANARNSVIGGGLNSKVGLTTDMTGQLNRLGENRSANQMGLDLGQGADYRNSLTSNLTNKMGIESQDRALSMGNNDGAFNAATNVLDKRNAATLNNRAMGLEDLAAQAGLTQQQMQEELTKLGLTSQQMQAGLSLEQIKQAMQDAGASQLTNQGNQEVNYGMQSQQLGNQSANMATNGYSQSLANEAANAGWGKKLLLGAGSSLLGTAMGGANPFAGLMGLFKKNPYGAQSGTY